jgi:GT2 family glycosyltransferase
MADLVYIIIVNWNGWADTLACLESCDQLSGAEYRLLVVDNASTDGSVDQLRAGRPGTRVIPADRNLGFAGGNNLGIAIALSEGADFVWLLNNDTTVAPDALEALLACAREHPEAGMFGSKVYYSAHPDVIWFAGGELAPTRAGYPRHAGSGQRDDGRWDQAGPVEFLSGCSLLVRTAVVEQIGPMREDYFMYWEDVEWSARAQETGWSCLYVPRSRVWHKVSASLEGTRYLDQRYETRNRLHFYKEHRPHRLRAVMLWTIRDALVLAIKGHWPNSRARLAGVADFLAGRTGAIAGPAPSK